MLREYLDTIMARLAALGLELPGNAYMFSNDPLGATPWNPDWAMHKVDELAATAGSSWACQLWVQCCRSP
jgi:hypothetical protein